MDPTKCGALEEGRKLFKSPWAARDAYIHVILDRSPERRAGFLAEQGMHQLGAENRKPNLHQMSLSRFRIGRMATELGILESPLVP
jgi:hypothetical protein